MDRMTRRLFVFDDPDRFLAGAVGDPGQRTFYLQARKGGALVSVSLEKVQVAALAERLAELLERVGGGEPSVATAVSTDEAPLDEPLDEPLVELFRVGPMAVAWEPESARIMVEAQPLSDDGEYAVVGDDAEDGPDLVRVRVAPERARAFIHGASTLIASGRPACPFCGQPLEPQGHFCSRMNGHLN